jgi:hypothetical protein
VSLAVLFAALALQTAPAPAAAPVTPPVVTDPLPPPPGADPAVPYDAAAWWTTPLVRPSAAQDPFFGRRARRGETPTRVEVGVEASIYRLWGLQPLQSRLVRRGEMILEVWRRPTKDLRQAVIRLTVRGDGRAFVNARAGLFCCDPAIGRRVDIDAELPDPAAADLLALRNNPLWSTSRFVEVDYGGGAVASLCVDGVSWDVILLVPGQVRQLRRACEDPAIGQIADVLTPALAAALGRDPRFDFIFPKGAQLTAEREAYAALLAGGGRLKPSSGGPQAELPPPEPAPLEGEDLDAPEEPAATPAPAPATAPAPASPVTP